MCMNPPAAPTMTFEEVFNELSHKCRMYVLEKLANPAEKKVDICERLGLHPEYIYNKKKVIDQAIDLAAGKVAEVALVVLSEHLMSAVLVKIGGLDVDDDRLRQKVATEIIEWRLGKARQAMDITSLGKGLGEVLSQTFDEALERVYGQ